MKQGDLGLNLTTKRTCKPEFLDEMNLVVPWAELVGFRCSKPRRLRSAMTEAPKKMMPILAAVAADNYLERCGQRAAYFA